MKSIENGEEKKINLYPTNGAFVCLTYVTSNSIVKRSLSSFKAFSNYGSPFSIVEKKSLYNHFVNIWTMKKR
ncbi:hypothetical protein T11_12566 [Trichinella zimbabwensis]|uniref:Uncharacterized protein n=1 Tax=Trichinella zimbabwensis TaxID=268475 RepID=A0A0V1HMF1_9BILA|nr:hypothetical protein T11_12566 [Trichinella zimbabwensis]